MPKSFEELMSLSQSIPSLVRQATDVAREGFTMNAAQQVAQQPTLRQGLSTMTAASPFPGAVDTQSPEMRTALATAQETEAYDKEEEAKALRKSVLKQGAGFADKVFKEIEIATKGEIKSPDISTVQDEKTLQAAWEYYGGLYKEWMKKKWTEDLYGKFGAPGGRSGAAKLSTKALAIKNQIATTLSEMKGYDSQSAKYGTGDPLLGIKQDPAKSEEYKKKADSKRATLQKLQAAFAKETSTEYGEETEAPAIEDPLGILK